ncbi:hypothetical protein OV079_52355 [Nannocystis pusilla]|uniref:Uncharacterized protein n=1 Tax=Nannocystis pusilla TaxID=889268 RepID=A0A9X3F0V0_9BACT|nr:hypothetical protein [Nannocystis pusilla]MCY1013982.1 hypothetical protein [Nannocystis pusilla]
MPPASCWTVPACDLCPDSFICINRPTIFGDSYRCEPRPASCGDEVDCECAGAACDDRNEVCAGGGNGDVDLVCDCPNC